MSEEPEIPVSKFKSIRVGHSRYCIIEDKNGIWRIYERLSN